MLSSRAIVVAPPRTRVLECKHVIILVTILCPTTFQSAAPFVRIIAVVFNRQNWWKSRLGDNTHSHRTRVIGTLYTRGLRCTNPDEPLPLSRENDKKLVPPLTVCCLHTRPLWPRPLFGNSVNRVRRCRSAPPPALILLHKHRCIEAVAVALLLL